MATTILSSLIVLLQLMSVIIVAPDLLTRSRIFFDVPEGRSSVNVWVIIIFLEALPVYDTAAGSRLNGAFITVRDPGPIPAGLAADFTVCSCVLATVIAGLFGGQVRLARSQGMDSKTMMAKIFDEVRVFCGDRSRSDDLTLTIIRTE